MMTMIKNSFLILRRAAFLVLLAAITPVAGCQTTGASSKPVTEAVSDYTLGVGDRIRINVYGQQELTNEYVVEPNGAISLPLVGTVGAAGYTSNDLKASIVDKLQPDFMVDPQVSVEVIGFRSMYVLGEVQQPGKYEYVPNMTVMQAVAIAGGYTYRASEGSAEVTRHVKGALNTFTVDDKTMLKPGDTILVKRRWF
jgi:polysaccharide biosynthesis/export protein